MRRSLTTLILPVLLLVLASPAPAQPGPPGTPVKAGQATLTFNGAALKFEHVSGAFKQSYGFTTIELNFSKDAKTAGGTHLSINVMVQEPGKVDLTQAFGNGIGMWWKSTIFAYEKGKSTCAVVLTKVSATEVEGTAECPTLNELHGSGTASLRNVKFFARTN
jgi:hypothetical protein